MVRSVTRITYFCEICGSGYPEEELAVACERSDSKVNCLLCGKSSYHADYKAHLREAGIHFPQSSLNGPKNGICAKCAKRMGDPWDSVEIIKV